MVDRRDEGKKRENGTFKKTQERKVADQVKRERKNKLKNAK